MNFKRPSFRRGGSTGINQLTPRVKAQEGFFGNRNMFLLPSNIKNLQNQRFDMGTSGGQILSNQRMKSFPMDASEMGIASVAKTGPKKVTSDFEEMVEIGGYGTIPKGPETDLNKLPSWMLSAIGTEETRKILKDHHLEEADQLV